MRNQTERYLDRFHIAINFYNQNHDYIDGIHLVSPNILDDSHATNLGPPFFSNINSIDKTLMMQGDI